jgi:hypothetical protein
MGSWSQKSVTGEQLWVIDTIHGIAGSPCAKVSGFSGGASNPNEDWLISPALNFDNFTNEILTFQTAKNYSGPELSVLISSDYDGAGDPNSFTWTTLTATFSSGNWSWTPSGIIDVSGTSGSNVYIAFKYVSDTASATWEVDEILAIGVVPLGISGNRNTDEFRVTPNPSHGQFRLTFKGEGKKDVQLISMVGREIYHTTTTLDEMEVNIPDLSPGIYFVKLTDVENSTVQTKKIIIH